MWARADIYEQLDALVAQGLAVLIVSSDIQEVLMVSHRILTIYRGESPENSRVRMRRKPRFWPQQQEKQAEHGR